MSLIHVGILCQARVGVPHVRLPHARRQTTGGHDRAERLAKCMKVDKAGLVVAGVDARKLEVRAKGLHVGNGRYDRLISGRNILTMADERGGQLGVWYKSCTALWYNSAGTRLLRIVVVRDPSGRRRDDCFFSTDLSLSAKAILELFAMRWPLEVAFYNAKQFLGLEDPQNRTSQAVRRTAPMALYLHTLVILWFGKHGRFNAEAYRRAHPWYAQKRTPSFADMLAYLKTASVRESISRYPGRKPPSLKKLRHLFQALEIAA